MLNEQDISDVVADIAFRFQVSRFTAEDIVRRAAQEYEEFNGLPGFREHMPAMRAFMHANPGVPLVEVYAHVVLPHLPK